jgi:hypothetical protein
MKNLAFLLLASVLFFTACDKENSGDKLNPTQTMYGLAINYTATWCGPCGNWGAPLIHDLKNVNASKVVAITVHASGDPMYLQNLYSEFSADRTTGGGIPSFWVGDITGSGGATANMQSLLAQIPDAGIDYKIVKNNGVFEIKAQVKFFNAVQGEYYLSTLVLEDGIDGSTNSGAYKQNGVSNPETYKHDFVLRASATGNSYGELLVNGPVTQNQTFDKTYSVNIDPTWTNDVYVVCLLWKKDNSTGAPNFKFVNAFVDKSKITLPTE